MYLSQCVKRAAQVSGNKSATIFGERSHTWNEFSDRIQRFAGGMQKLGISAGERVAILALNSDRYLELFFAIPWAGAVMVPINIRLAAPEILFTLNDAEAEILVVDDAFASLLPALEGKMTTVKKVIFSGDGETPAGCVNYEELIANNEPVDDAERGGGDIAGLFYTGGTTGRSKGVMLSHDNLMSNALNVIPFMKFDESSIYLHVAPMFHLADCASTFSLTMAAGTHTFLPKFDPQETLKVMQDKKVSVCLLVPTMVNMLVNYPDFGQYDVSSLKTILYGASPMPEAVLLRAMELFPNCEFKQGYGMTETSPVIAFLDSKFHVTEGPLSGKLKSAGYPAFGVEVLVVDENDKERPRGEVGEVIARGPNVMQGYWKM
ncbi:MAG: AMP-binding protein, partial [Pseudomonadales bacterium]|nr:AMP-binding protein [Pseudomonadales bacterium]